MFNEQGFDHSLLRTSAFVARTLTAGAVVPAGAFEIQQQLLADQQTAHTLIINAQTAPFNDPIIPDCVAGLSVNARYFKESDPSTLPNHDRFKNGALKYQTGDVLLEPAEGQVLAITDQKSAPVRVLIDRTGKGVRLDGKTTEGVINGKVEKRTDIVAFNRTSDKFIDNKYVMTLLAEHSSGWGIVINVPCGEFQPLSAQIYKQVAGQIPTPRGTPGPTIPTPTLSPDLALYYEINSQGQLIPKGLRAIEVDLRDVERVAQATATVEKTATPKAQSKPYEILIAEERVRAANENAANDRNTKVAIQNRPTPTPVVVRVVERETENPIPWVLVAVVVVGGAIIRFGGWIGDRWEDLTRPWRRPTPSSTPPPPAPTPAAAPAPTPPPPAPARPAPPPPATPPY